MGRFRFRKGIPIIPGFVRLNASGSAGGGKTKGGTSWTFHFGKLISYNTRTGVTSINPPGPGSWQSSPRSTRKKAKERKKALKAADQAYWRKYAEDVKAGREPDMRGAPSRRGPNGQLPRKRRAPAAGSQRKARSQPARAQSSSRARRQPDGVVHAAEPRPEQRTVGGVPVTASGVPMRRLRPAEYGFLTPAQQEEYAALPMSVAGLTAAGERIGKSQEEWEAELFPEYGGLSGWRQAQKAPEETRPRTSRRWDGEPETERDKRFFDLRESGYKGPIDPDGYAVDEDGERIDPAAWRAERHVSALDNWGLSQEEYNRLPIAERQAVQIHAGNCGAITKDGTPCLNSANCPHHRGMLA